MTVIVVTAVFAGSLSVSAAPEQKESNLVTRLEHFCVKCDFGGQVQSGFAGTIVDVGDSDISVTELGRYCYDAVMKKHTLKLVDTDGNLLAQTTVEGGAQNTFIYGKLSSPVTLKANTSYYLLSDEGLGDSYSDGCDNFYGTSAAVAAGYVRYADGAYKTVRFANSGYVGLDMKFTYTPSAEEPSDTAVAFGDDFTTVNYRNDYHSYIGGKIGVGSKDLIVTELGRLFVDGNKQVHNVKIVDAATCKDVVGASVDISGGEAGKFTYVKLETPVVLKANTTYYIMSREYADGDKFAEGDSQFFPVNPDDISLLGRAFFIQGYNDDLGMNYSFVGLNFKYAYADGSSITKDTSSEKPTSSNSLNVNIRKNEKQNKIPTWVWFVAGGAVVVLAAGAVVIVMTVKKSAKNGSNDKQGKTE